MALYLVTGQPGHGKTAYALDKAFKFQKEGRAIFAHGVKDLDYAKAGWTYVEDPKKWEQLPDGAVVLLDECYDVPPRLSSEAVWSPILNDKEIGREEALFRRADHRLPTRS